MAGYGWNNTRHGNNVQGLNLERQQLAHKPSQIACRLCDQVFLSTQALISHIETHMLQDDASRRHHQHQRDLLAVNPYRPAFPATPALKTQPFLPVQFTSPMPCVMPQLVNISQPMILPPPTAPPPQMMAPPAMMTFVQPRQEINASDFTKPLLSLLERPIPKPTAVVDKPTGIVLDLTLKL